MPVTTTNHETFTDQESAKLAALIYKRFGRELDAAVAAWRRLLGNTCTQEQFRQLVNEGLNDQPVAPVGMTRYASVSLVHGDGREETISNIERATPFRVEVVTGEAARTRFPLPVWPTRDDEPTKP